MNVLKAHLRITIETLLGREASQREIARRTGVDRKTIRRFARALANSPGVATGSATPGGPTPPPRLRIPTKSITRSDACRSVIPVDADHRSERSDAGVGL